MATETKLSYQRYRHYFNAVGQIYAQKKVRTYGGIVLSLFAIAFFLIFAIKPTLVAIASLKKEIQDQQEIADKLDKKISALSQAQQIYYQLLPDFSLIDEAMPKTPDLGNLAILLEVIASRNSVALGSVLFNLTPLQWSGQNLKDPQLATFSISVDGTYENLNNFLSMITRTKRLTAINSLGFRPSKKNVEGSNNNLTLTVSANGYYFDLSSPPAAIKAK